jgi:hypothetical protein
MLSISNFNAEVSTRLESKLRGKQPGLVIEHMTPSEGWSLTLAGGASLPLSLQPGNIVAVALTDTLVFTPSKNWFGQAALSFRAWDGSHISSGEASSGLPNQSVSSQSYAATVQVLAVNDEPVFTKTLIRAPHVPGELIQTSSYAITVAISGTLSRADALVLVTQLSFILECDLNLEGLAVDSQQ